MSKYERYDEKPVNDKVILQSEWARKWAAEFDAIRKKLLNSGYNLNIPITKK